MESWWEDVASLEPDALIWLIGLATHGGTFRDKPPTIGTGKTTDTDTELSKATRYASVRGLDFDPKAGYKALRRVKVQAPNGKQGTILTRAKGGGHMQLTSPVGIVIFNHIAGNKEFREYLEEQLGVGEQEEEDPIFPDHEGADIQFHAQHNEGSEELDITAIFDCLRPTCDATVKNTYSMKRDQPWEYVEVRCEHCGLGHRHFAGGVWIPPEIDD